MGLFGKPTEREQWRTPRALARLGEHRGIAALEPRGAELYGRQLPRNAGVARPAPDREPINKWMRPGELMRFGWTPG